MALKSAEVPCPECGNSFKPTRKWQKFCTTKCWQINYNRTRDIPGLLKARRKMRKALDAMK